MVLKYKWMYKLLSVTRLRVRVPLAPQREELRVYLYLVVNKIGLYPNGRGSAFRPYYV